VLRLDTLLATAHARELAPLFQFLDGGRQALSLLAPLLPRSAGPVNRALESQRCAPEMMRTQSILALREHGSAMLHCGKSLF